MSTVIDTSGKGRNVGTNIWLGLLVLSLLVFGANTAYSITKAQRLGGASSAASNLQVNSQRLANQGRDAVGGDAEAFAAFRETREQMADDVRLLNDRFGKQPGVSAPIETVTATWLPLSKSAEQVSASEKAVTGLAGNANSFVQKVPQLQAQMDEVVRAMLASGSASSQVYLAVREGILAATMARRVAEIQAGGPGAQIAGGESRRVFLAKRLNVPPSENVGGSWSGAEFWADTLDRWAEEQPAEIAAVYEVNSSFGRLRSVGFEPYQFQAQLGIRYRF